MDANDVVLSYHESLLRRSDVELLRGPCWLNDTVISFYFEYLEVGRFKGSPLLLFVPPQVTQCIKVTPGNEIGTFLDPLNSDNAKEFIFFALNDNEQTERSGGSHWSLLVFSYPERMVYHFDSSRGSNQQQAYDLANKLLKFYGCRYGSFCEPDCLQQTNGYDCGIHVLCNTENVAKYAFVKRRVEGCPVLDRQSVNSKRAEMLDLIHTLRRNSMNNK